MQQKMTPEMLAKCAALKLEIENDIKARQEEIMKQTKAIENLRRILTVALLNQGDQS